MLTASDDKTLKVFLTEEKKFQFSLTGHKNWVRVGTFSPDSRLIASGGDDKTVFMWDTEFKTVVTQYHEHLGIVYDAKFNPDGTCLASCSQDRKIKLFDMRSKRQIQHYDAHGDTVFRVDFHPNSTYLVSSSADSKIKVITSLRVDMGHQKRSSSIYSLRAQWKHQCLLLLAARRLLRLRRQRLHGASLALQPHIRPEGVHRA